MTKNLEIKVKLDAEFETSADPNLDDWNNANDVSKQLYIKERVKEYIIDNIDKIVDDLLENSEIVF